MAPTPTATAVPTTTGSMPGGGVGRVCWFMRPVKSISVLPLVHGDTGCTDQTPDPMRTVQLLAYVIVALPPGCTMTWAPGASSACEARGTKPLPLLMRTEPPCFSTVAALAVRVAIRNAQSAAPAARHPGDIFMTIPPQSELTHAHTSR